MKSSSLRRLREKAGLSQTELGLKVFLTQKTISAYETGERKPKYPMLIKLSKALNCSIFELDSTYGVPAIKLPWECERAELLETIAKQEEEIRNLNVTMEMIRVLVKMTSKQQ